MSHIHPKDIFEKSHRSFLQKANSAEVNILKECFTGIFVDFKVLNKSFFTISKIIKASFYGIKSPKTYKQMGYYWGVFGLNSNGC